jgi:hypothetical protein
MSNNRIKIPLFLAINAQFNSAFNKLLGDSALKNPAGEAWALARTQRNLVQLQKDEFSIKMALAKKHGSPVEGDEKKGFTISAEQRPAFEEDYNAAVSADVEIFLDHKLALHEPLPPDSKLTPADVSALWDLLVITDGLVQGAPNANHSPAGPEASPAASEEARVPGNN